MNNLAIIPYIGLHALQIQNVKRNVAKKATKIISDDTSNCESDSSDSEDSEDLMSVNTNKPASQTVSPVDINETPTIVEPTTPKL